MLLEQMMLKLSTSPFPPPNQPPITSAGPDQTVNVGNKVTLDGSGSKDPDGSITSYSWRQIAGPAAKLSRNNTMNPSFIAPNVSLILN